jgi:hypothetical protein
MQRFMVTVRQQFDADTAEEAALLMYQTLTKGPAPESYSVEDETNATFNFTLDRTRANDFAVTDHTADPGNW